MHIINLNKYSIKEKNKPTYKVIIKKKFFKKYFFKLMIKF